MPSSNGGFNDLSDIDASRIRLQVVVGKGVEPRWGTVLHEAWDEMLKEPQRVNIVVDDTPEDKKAHECSICTSRSYAVASTSNDKCSRGYQGLPRDLRRFINVKTLLISRCTATTQYPAFGNFARRSSGNSIGLDHMARRSSRGSEATGDPGRDKEGALTCMEP